MAQNQVIGKNKYIIIIIETCYLTLKVCYVFF